MSKRSTITRRRRNERTSKKGSCSLSSLIVYGIIIGMFLYVVAVVVVTKSLHANNTSSNSQVNDMMPPRKDVTQAKQSNTVPRVNSNDEWGDRVKRPGKREWGHGVVPQLLRKPSEDRDQHENDSEGEDFVPDRENTPSNQDDTSRPILTAFLEPIDKISWNVKPLPPRDYTSDDLTAVKYTKLNSCSKLPEQWPVDDYPEGDPFLPWIHDVFPTHDGKFIQFVAQNKRRCRTGTTLEDIRLLNHTEPQITLFQHVAVKRLNQSTSSQPIRYRLSSHEEADPDGVETRFICRFKPSGEETLSVYNFNYEWASFRKRIREVFHDHGRDNKQVHTSQLTFQCPVPTSLVETVRTGNSVQNDFATLFVDLIPIRTPPRYGPPTSFLPAYYDEFRAKGENAFLPMEEWGQNHVLPKVEDSGRWENIPICKPSLLTYDNKKLEEGEAASSSTAKITVEGKPEKKHNLISCLWASTGYATRGNRFAINDGQRRLLEFITYSKLIGTDHFYLYDNSGAFSSDPANSLRPIADLFPDDVTVINWPSQVCNNNPNNVDSPGERSSQYAAEASCRLRFGPHTNWISQFDIDEYIIPMGNYTSILPLLEKLDAEGNKIVSFPSWRAWPRRRFIETPVRLTGVSACGRKEDCFQLQIPMNYTMLQSYNCDRQKPGEKSIQMPAEKQIYRPDYVKHHFIHYSTVTERSILNRQDTVKQGLEWVSGSAFPDPLSRFGDEVNEALMLHTKAVATQDTIYWETACDASYTGKSACRLGTPFPENMTGVNISRGDEGWKFNCYVNRKIDDYWVPLLERDLKSHIPELASRMDAGTRVGR